MTADDSMFSEEDIAKSTVSISSSIMRYREENGRTYHAYNVVLLASFNLVRHYPLPIMTFLRFCEGRFTASMYASISPR